MAELHPEIAPLAFLLGVWEGQGMGSYPTIEPFEYRERIELSHIGKPFLAYSQSSWHLREGRSLHGEVGYWRLAGGQVELLLAHPTGIVEVEEGSLEGCVIDLVSRVVGLASSAKEVVRLHRRFVVAGDRLSYRLEMAAVGQPLLTHLEAELFRRA